MLLSATKKTGDSSREEKPRPSLKNKHCGNAESICNSGQKTARDLVRQKINDYFCSSSTKFLGRLCRQTVTNMPDIRSCKKHPHPPIPVSHAKMRGTCSCYTLFEFTAKVFPQNSFPSGSNFIIFFPANE